MAAGSRTQILLLSHMCDIVTSQTWKVDERKPVEQEDIEKKVGIFTFWMVFYGGESNGLFENDFAAFFVRTRTFFNIYL